MQKVRWFLLGWLFSNLLSLIFLGLYFLNIGGWLTVRRTTEKADAIHVLGGDSCDFHRTKHAVSLYQSGVADTLVLTGSGNQLAEVINASVALGVPVRHRIVVDGCLSTRDEALAIKKLNKPWMSIVLVTDIYHTRRSVRTFQKILPGVRIFSSPALNSTYDKKNWWRTEAGFVAVFEETFKLIYYLFRYGINPL